MFNSFAFCPPFNKFLFFNPTLLPLDIELIVFVAIWPAIFAPRAAGIPTWTNASVILPAAVSRALSSKPSKTSPTTLSSINFSNLATALSSILTPSPFTASYTSAATEASPTGILINPDPIPDATDTAKLVSVSGSCIAYLSYFCTIGPPNI